MTRTTIGLAALPLAAAAGLALATGGAGASGGGDAHAAKTLSILADANDFKFSSKKLVAKHGLITIRMFNPTNAATSHGIALDLKKDKEGEVVDPGGMSKVSARLKKGRYTYYCPVDGHRVAGMKGTLIVK